MMQIKGKNKKRYVWLLRGMLLASIVVTTMGCSDRKQEQEKQTTVVETEVIGTEREGNVSFLFTVVDKDGNETRFEVFTDKKMVGEALLEAELITGEEGPYGLYINSVNGITADYAIDGSYWAFYINGEYATSGVDTTPVTEGESYCFKVEK